MRGWTWWSALVALASVCGLGCQPPQSPRASAAPTLRQTCERAGWNACRELSDGVRRYLQGDLRGADLRFSAVAQVNDAQVLANAAEAIRRIGRAPDAAHAASALEAAARRLIVFAATPLPPPESETPVDPKRRSAATIVRTARDVDYAANRTLAAPVDPTRLLTQTADSAPRAESVPCLAVGRPARCTPLLEGPLLVTDVVGSPGCASAGAIGSLELGPRATAMDTSVPVAQVEPIEPGASALPPVQPPTVPRGANTTPAELRWVVTPPPPGLTGAAFFVSAKERLVAVHFESPPKPEPEPEPATKRSANQRAESKPAPESTPQPEPTGCQLTWAGFRPRALPSQSFPDATRPPIENPYR